MDGEERNKRRREGGNVELTKKRRTRAQQFSGFWTGWDRLWNSRKSVEGQGQLVPCSIQGDSKVSKRTNELGKERRGEEGREGGREGERGRDLS